MACRVVFEDDFIIVADKPSGLLSVPTPKNEKITLGSLLKAFPAHRLDRETSGLTVLAKTKKMRDTLAEEFRERGVKKRYLAFVQGKMPSKEGIIDRKVQDNPYEPAKSALTQYRVLESRKGFSVVEVVPLTGRTNQIRIHFKQIGHPLVGERRFAFARDFALKFRRTALHSAGLEFRHPHSGEWISFQSDLPRDMREFLERD